MFFVSTTFLKTFLTQYRITSTFTHDLYHCVPLMFLQYIKHFISCKPPFLFFTHLFLTYLDDPYLVLQPTYFSGILAHYYFHINLSYTHKIEARKVSPTCLDLHDSTLNQFS